MASRSRNYTYHFLFHGELSDAPGRNESWDEYIRYRGKSRWELIIEGTDFYGTSEAEPVKEVMSTKALLNWVLEQDAQGEAGETKAVDDPNGSEDDDLYRQFGPRAARLRDIAGEVGAAYCASCLDGWLAGLWPPEKRQSVRILDVKGVTQRAIWIGVHHSVYEIDTNRGPGFLYPPDADRAAKLVLKSESSMSAGRIVKVPILLMAKIEALKPCLESLAKH